MEGQTVEEFIRAAVPSTESKSSGDYEGDSKYCAHFAQHASNGFDLGSRDEKILLCPVQMEAEKMQPFFRI